MKMAYARQLGLAKQEKARFRQERQTRAYESRLFWQEHGASIRAGLATARKNTRATVREWVPPVWEPSSRMAGALECYWCGLPYDMADPRLSRTREHLVPRTFGGRGGHNIVGAHKSCNNKRGTAMNWVPFSAHGRRGECVTA